MKCAIYAPYFTLANTFIEPCASGNIKVLAPRMHLAPLTTEIETKIKNFTPNLSELKIPSFVMNEATNE